MVCPLLPRGCNPVIHICLMDRHLTYFASDVHLGLDVKGPEEREKRFVSFLKGIPAAQTEALYLLGDIWDFWYEYRDVVPKGYLRVLSALQDLMDGGVKVYFFQGNHDVWTFSYFESLGMIPLVQPHLAVIGGKLFCLGHGDGLGPGDKGYKILRRIFHSKTLQALFSTLHPWIAFRLGNNWSRHSRLAKDIPYEFRGEEEPLYAFCRDFTAPDGSRPDFFIFGHFHCRVEIPVGKTPSKLLILKDWMDGECWIEFDASTGRYLYRSGTLTSGGASQNIE